MKGEVEKLYKLVSEGHKRIGEDVSEKAILLLGKTGVGKSSLACLFADKDLEAFENEEGNLVVDTKEKIQDLKINHQKISETKVPVKITSKSGLTVWDCPGFEDIGKDPIQDIANAFYIQRLFETTKHLKFVLVVPEYFAQGKGDDLVKSVENFSKVFKIPEQVQNSVYLVVTKAAANKKVEHIQKSLNNILKDQGEFLEEKTKKMLPYLSNSTEIFHTPLKTGLLKKTLDQVKGGQENSILAHIENKGGYYTPKEGEIKIFISDNSKALSDNLFKNSYDELLKLLNEAAVKIQEVCAKVNDKGNEIKGFGRFKNSLNSIFFNEKEKHHKELLNLDAILVFGNFCDLVLNSQNDSKNFLNLLDERISDVAKYLAFSQNENSVKNLEYHIKENFKYVKFLSTVCEYKIDVQNFLNIFSKTKQEVDVASQKGAENMNIKENDQSLEYYDTAISFLNKYSGNQKCNLEKAKAYFYRAKILDAGKKPDHALNSCLTSINLNPNNQDPFNLIDEICLRENDRTSYFQGKSNILKYLFDKNQNIFNAKLAEAQSLINSFLNKQSENNKVALREYIDKLCFVRDFEFSIAGAPSVGVNNFVSDLNKILLIIEPDRKDLREGIEKYAHYIKSINQFAANAYNASIDSWKNYLNVKQIEDSITASIKKVDLNGGDVKFYERIIEFTNLGYIAQDDTDIINKRASSNFEIGNIKQNGSSYEEAANYYAKAVTLNKNLPEAYRKMDEIYFLSGLKEILAGNQEILKPLSEFNGQECLKAIKQRIELFAGDYINPSSESYFQKTSHKEGKHFARLDYMDRLLELKKYFFDMSSKPVAQNFNEFLKNLENLSKLFTHYAKAQQTQGALKGAFEGICDKVWTSKTGDDLYGIETLLAQLNYFKALTDKSQDALKQSNENIMNSFSSFFAPQKAENSFLTTLKTTDLVQTESKNQYYERIVKYASLYPGEKECLTLNAQANLCLARCDSPEKYYLEAIKVNETLANLCKGNDDAFYAKHSVKREAYEKLGDFYDLNKNYEKAFNAYQEVGCHIKAKKSLKLSIEQDPENYARREKQGDYFAKIGMVDSALDSYHEALGLTKDPAAHNVLNTKISQTLSSAANKANEFSQKATQIQNTQIVYSVTEEVFENPLLNRLEKLSGLNKLDFNEALDLGQKMAESGQKHLLRNLMENYSGVELLEKMELYSSVLAGKVCDDF